MEELNWWRPFKLALFLLGLGLIAVYLEYTFKPKKESEKETAQKIVSINDIPMATLGIDSGKTRFEFRCDDIDKKLCKPGDQSKWIMQSPIKALGDRENINHLLSTIESTVGEDVIDLKKDTPDTKQRLLKSYGLDIESRKNSKKITMTSGQTAQHTYEIWAGIPIPTGESIYTLAAIDGKVMEDRVVLMPANFKRLFEHDLNHWRNKKLFSVAFSDINEFKVKTITDEYSARKSDGNWIVTESKKGSLPITADYDVVQNYLQSVTTLAAKEVHAEDKKGFDSLARGGKPIVLLKFKTQEKETELKAIEKNKSIFATVSDLDPLFVLQANDPVRIIKSFSDFRPKRVISLQQRRDIKKIELKYSDKKTYQIDVKGEQFNVTQGSIPNFSSEKMKRFLDRLSANIIQEFKISTQTGEWFEMDFISENSAPKTTIRFWKANGSIWAQIKQDRSVNTVRLDHSIETLAPWSVAALGASAS